MPGMRLDVVARSDVGRTSRLVIHSVRHGADALIVLIRVPVGPHLPRSTWDRFCELDESLSMKKAHREFGRYSHYQVRPLPEA